MSRRVRRSGMVLVAVLTVVLGVAQPAAAAPVPVVPTDETTPVAHGGDAADDPAIWVHPTNPGASLVIGNDKLGALETYDLDGTRRQRITTSTTRWGNVDVRGNLVVAWNGGGARVYRVNPSTRMLSLATDGNGVVGTASNGEGLCLYQSASTLYVFVVTRLGVVQQYALGDADRDGRYEGRLVRQFDLGSESESCVADDANGALYVSQEDVALWRYGAAPSAGSTRTAVDRVTSQGGRIAADAEGVTVVGSYLILSAQNVAAPGSSFFLVYNRNTNAFVKEFRVVNGTAADDCDRTDGLEAYAGNLGPLYPNGLFVCQDGPNVAPGSAGNQNFKFVPFQRIVAA